MAYKLIFWENDGKTGFVENRSVIVKSIQRPKPQQGLPGTIKVIGSGWPQRTLTWDLFLSQTIGNLPITLVTVNRTDKQSEYEIEIWRSSKANPD